MKILPCPFCAREIKSVYKFENSSIYTITCKCGAQSPKDSISEQGAIRIWNRRRYITPKQKKFEMLNKEASEVKYRCRFTKCHYSYACEKKQFCIKNQTSEPNTLTK